MPSFHKLAALAALTLGASAANDCPYTKEFEIDSVNPDFPCQVIDATVTVSESLGGNLVLRGVTEFKKDFVVKNATNLLSISSSSLETIGGEFIVEDGLLLSTINLSSLTSLNKLTLNRLKQLNSLTFSSEGVSEASTVQIDDTFLSDLSGLSLTTVEDMKISNNNKLSMFDSKLVNITKTFILLHNGDMQVNLTDLESAYELQLSNIKSLSVPSLTEVQSALRFDTNPSLESFEAANLTNVGTSKNGGSISFINNVKLVNVSFPRLTKISGDLTIVNNTKIDEISGFPELKSIDNMLLGGAFENASLPKLDDVKGTINVASTSNITDVCTFFNGLGKKVVQGKINCKSNADEKDTQNPDKANKTKSGKGDSGAGSPGFSTAAIFLGLIAGAVQLL